MSVSHPCPSYDGPPRNVAFIDQLQFDDRLQPRPYSIAGTPPESRILILDAQIVDATGKAPYRGDVLIVGERFTHVGQIPEKQYLLADPNVRVFQANGRTLIPGLGDAHTHLTWNGGDLERLGELGIEEHTLLTARSARCFLDSGYTMCFGAASAQKRLDVVVRDAINRGDIPGPRCLANEQEIARRDGALVPGITAYADGPEEMRQVIHEHVTVGVDQVKLSMSGESITQVRDAEDCYFSPEETAACVDEAHKHGIRLCAHARARDSIRQCIDYGVEVIYHASYMDKESMDLLEQKRTQHVVVPALNWLVATLYEAEPFGYATASAEKAGYKKELRAAIVALREMHRRGIVLLPGGDYGFAWTPHGTYARDLEHFTELLGFTAHEAIIAASYGVAKLFMRSHELGQIKPGNYADCVLVDGDPLQDIAILQDHQKLNVILINGRVHKAGPQEVIMHLTENHHPSHKIAPSPKNEVKEVIMQNAYWIALLGSAGWLVLGIVIYIRGS
ncbi:composite domain of metallo-dependent hydrolase [Aspergillus steynii IBT 23096]|uniref:Composite domain of metallo-dependent hydrolase n=1 Tax=Aspergillus steynii IBT 23096 TaxID=1392250 RepID=A0A2I2G3K6_9EURO|nr:composite domain of metallo-dependent hydrolase [Aspergillus steynii IBT 23096]PLB47460.1 composite domain of metallo-dependent hydrolase [Aspergillus steynii IBT 23096]